jgi:hypothetical protein
MVPRLAASEPALRQRAGRVARRLLPPLAAMRQALDTPEGRSALQILRQAAAGSADPAAGTAAAATNQIIITSYIVASARWATPEQLRDAGELAAWAAAAAAALCLQPLEAQLALEQLQQRNSRMTETQLAGSAQDCLLLWAYSAQLADRYLGSAAVLAARSAAARAELAALAPALCQVHARACRLLHHMLGSPPAVRALLERGRPDFWLAAAGGLASTLLAAQRSLDVGLQDASTAAGSEAAIM